MWPTHRSQRRTISVSRAIDVSIVAIGGLILDMGRVDGDTASLLLGSLVNLAVVGEFGGTAHGKDPGNGGGQRRLTVVDVT